MRKATVNTSQKMPRDWSRAKLTFVGGVFCLIWLGLWVRAGYLQIVEGPKLAQQALKQHLASETDKGSRGRILDRNGRALATSVSFTAICARPREIKDPAAASETMAKALGVKAADIRAALTSDKPFVYVARRVGDRAAAQIKEAAIPGIELVEEHGRSYPNRHLAGQILGFVSLDDTGLDGLEKSFDQHLRGHQARFVVQRDASGRKMYIDDQGRELGELDGHDLKLTIDAQIQFFVEEELAKAVVANNAKGGVMIVVHVPTGEILALANYPFFNPNAGRGANQALAKNRAALDALEPGSTMKPLLVAAALQENVVKPDTKFYCENGKFQVTNRIIKDTHSYGDLTVNKIVRSSSNIGAAKIGMLMGQKKLHAYFTRLGFATPTGLPLAGEAKGLLRPLKDWQPIDLATASFGQGVAVTPLQMAQAFLVIANDGVKRPLSLVLDPAPQPSAEPPVRVFDTKVARMVQDMMREVVHEEGGTGKAARIEGLTMGGKTGTAQKASAKGGYGNKYLGSFVAFVPAAGPEYLVLCMVDEPEPSHYGGVVAAPAVREVTLRTLAYLGRMPETAKAAVQEAPTPKISPADRAILDIAATPAAAPRAPGPEALAKSERLPDFAGMPLRRAVEILMERGIAPDLKGQGLIVGKQHPAPGAPWPKDDNAAVTLWLNRPSG